ncbi:Arrestin domain-containing protein 2 [Mactra antiquata]
MAEQRYGSSKTGKQVLHKNVSQFEIVILNNHNKTYYPGQYLEGHVIVKVEQQFITRGILLQFCGRAEIFWSEKQRGAEDKCIGIMDYNAKEEFFNIRHFVFEPGLIPADVHKFPFKFHLTPPLPDNYRDNICEIEYFLETRLKIDTDINNDLVHRQDILIVDPIDLNKLIVPDVTLPVHSQKMMKLGILCCKSEPVIAFLRLIRSGYSPGEVIHVQADVENNSGSSVRNVTFTLYEERAYITEHKTYTHRDVVVQVNKGSVRSKATEEWSDIPLSIPKHQVFNVSPCTIFDIRHTLEMEMKAGLFNKRLVIPLRIVIGSISLDSVSKETLPMKRLHLKPTEDQLKERRDAVRAARQSKTIDVTVVNARHIIVRRQRRKDRNMKIYPDDVIDTADYRGHN